MPASIVSCACAFRYMATSLHTPDHNARLIYDDFNELFWSRRCLDLLQQHAKDTGTTEQGLKSKAQFAHPQADTRSFSDSFLRSDARPKDEKARCMGLSVSRENLNAVIAELSCSSKPGSGVKTFVEHRTYAQVSCTTCILSMNSHVTRLESVARLNKTNFSDKRGQLHGRDNRDMHLELLLCVRASARAVLCSGSTQFLARVCMARDHFCWHPTALRCR